MQTSLYGASKLAGEGLIQAYCEGFGFQGYIFRFVSILGERYTHGHVFDFYQQPAPTPHSSSAGQRQAAQDLPLRPGLRRRDPARRSSKAQDRSTSSTSGTDEYCEVNDSIGWISEHLGLKPALDYTGGERGWIGDSPFIFLDTSRIRALGWKPKLTIREGVIRTLDYLAGQPLAAGRARDEGLRLGLWHLGTVTAACLAAAGHDVIGLDPDAGVRRGARDGKPPLFEPGLETRRRGLAGGRLRFTTDAAAALAAADVVWIAYDTPVDDDDRADVGLRRRPRRAAVSASGDGALVLISSQVPVGHDRAARADVRAGAAGARVGFAYSPENLRLGQAIEVFTAAGPRRRGRATRDAARAPHELLARRSPSGSSGCRSSRPR